MINVENKKIGFSSFRVSCRFQDPDYINHYIKHYNQLYWLIQIKIILLFFQKQGMSLGTEMLIDIAQTHGDSHLRPLEAELINLKRQIMTDKQILQEQSMTLSGKVEQLRPLSVRVYFLVWK